ncbi:MAG TPA: serine hydrolase domain-containing protein [Jatrophihabitans sp.]|jgi:CubicO group peptidase (beta-lactamase class C family)
MATAPDVAAGFSGVVSIRTAEQIEFEQAYGLADRAHEIAMTTGTRLAIASAVKGFTAVTVLALVADGLLTLDTTARSLLEGDLPLIDDAVTVEQLLTHRSGIGDYVDEDLPEPEPLAVPVYALDSTPAYLPALDGFSQKFAPGSRFSYCNAGYVVLALCAERAAGRPFAALVHERVCLPGGLTDTGFPRSDALPGNAAIGYLEDGRTNLFELPVVGSGDGGAYSTVGDIRAFWTALLGGRLLDPAAVTRMATPTTTDTAAGFAYGTGLWLVDGGAMLLLEGADQGVSFRSVHTVATGRTATVISNTGDGAWPIAKQLCRGSLGSGRDHR